MIEVKRKISKEEYDKAQDQSPYVLIDESIQIGYGAYHAAVYEMDGKYYLRYDRGSSCD